MSPQALLYAVAGLCAAYATPSGSRGQLVSDLNVIQYSYYSYYCYNSALKRMAREPSPRNR